MSIYRNCVNCGTQNLVDIDFKPMDKCIHCGESIGIRVNKKEEPLVEETHKDETSENVQAPQPQEAPPGEQSGPLYIGKPQKYRRGTRKWEKICKECELHHFHDEIIWCSSKRCPKHCPPALRPAYRPKDIIKPKKEKKAKETRAASAAATQSLEDTEEVCAGCPVVQAFKGYRLAVKDILVSLKRSKGSH